MVPGMSQIAYLFNILHWVFLFRGNVAVRPYWLDLFNQALMLAHQGFYVQGACWCKPCG